jgi:fluoride exporter
VEREPDIDAAEEAGEDVAAPVAAGELLAIFAGGVLGALARAGLEEGLSAAPASWPWATFIVNLTASGALGYVIGWLGEHEDTIRARAFLATGACGALSTFSAVIAELVRLHENSGPGLACAYGAASVIGGLAAVLLGLRLGKGAERR